MSRRLGAGIAGAAVLIGAITILARVTGFAKQLVFARAVGTNCLATAYYTANQVPNIIFELVVGGALAGMVVPVLAGAAARPTSDARAEVGRISSALLTWVLVLLIPLGLLTALFAGPVTRLLTS
jgi:peptidoglycan biosynthesis protein MviN/MurJ (putative lipid II flippase)